MRIATLLSVVAFAPALAVADGPSQVHAGQWEITTTIMMPGMPMQIPPVTHSQCMTQKDAAPKSQNRQHGDCQVVDQKIEAGKVSWKVKCTNGSEGAGQVTYTGETFEGGMTLKVKNQRTGQTMEMQQTMKGRRTGDCK